MTTAKQMTVILAAGAAAVIAPQLPHRRLEAADRAGGTGSASAAAQPRTQLSPAATGGIVRRPAPLSMLRDRGPLVSLPSYGTEYEKAFKVDLRARDLRALDLAERIADLRHADFDSRTRWPAKLPAGFDPAAVLELGRNPGLGVRAVHARGITGAGVGIGIVDQTLLVEHVEYRERLRSYEELHSYGLEAQMHGPAVASIAVGKSVGVAPGADLYYVAATSGTYEGRTFQRDYQWLGKAIERLLEINTRLPAGRKIRVISVSLGWSSNTNGVPGVLAAIERATAANVFVITTSLERTHRISFQGLGRDPNADPDRVAAYRPGAFWSGHFWGGGRFPPGKRLLVPMDSRTVASPAAADEYVHYAAGGLSWSVPWVAGLYALACQVKPAITPDQFWKEALDTGSTIRLERDGEAIEFGTIANPVALVARLQES